MMYNIGIQTWNLESELHDSQSNTHMNSCCFAMIVCFARCSDTHAYVVCCDMLRARGNHMAWILNDLRLISTSCLPDGCIWNNCKHWKHAHVYVYMSHCLDDDWNCYCDNSSYSSLSLRTQKPSAAKCKSYVLNLSKYKDRSKSTHDHNSTPLAPCSMIVVLFESSRRDLSICSLRSRIENEQCSEMDQTHV
jgi:hypothetical protein